MTGRSRSRIVVVVDDTDVDLTERNGPMTGLEWTLLSILIVLYITMMIVLGVTTLRKGRPALFVAGIFFPIFWIIGAVMPPAPTVAEVMEADREHNRLYAN